MAVLTTAPTFGVEEELLLVDAESGAPFMEGTAVRHVANSLGLDLDLELTPCQIETASPILDTAEELNRFVVSSRRTADLAAREMGGRVLACGVPPAPGDAHPVSANERYGRIADNFGLLAREQGVSGCHVHVAVPDRARAIAVGNGLRPWLPVLLALTTNSAIHDGVDSGYSSWRTVLWSRWPSAGPPPHFDSESDYDAAVTRLLMVGAALDKGMIYWDVRPSRDYPTVEVRVADVPATASETVLYATVVRALVMTELAAIEGDGPAHPTIDRELLRLGKWRAARDGIAGSLVDPVGGDMVAARTAVDALIEHVSDALDVLDEGAAVRDGVASVFAEGNGAVQQRRVFAESGVRAVVEHAARQTIAAGTWAS
nr:glutamate--cysteine ligase [Williamsia soli]